MSSLPYKRPQLRHAERTCTLETTRRSRESITNIVCLGLKVLLLTLGIYIKGRFLRTSLIDKFYIIITIIVIAIIIITIIISISISDVSGVIGVVSSIQNATVCPN